MIQTELGRKIKEENKSILIDHIYEEFRKDSNTYPRHYMSLSGKEYKQKRKVPLKVFKKIIKTYLKVYFTEFFSSGKSMMYFMFPGDLYFKKNPGRVLKSKDGSVTATREKVALVWINRSSRRAYQFIKLKKVRVMNNNVFNNLEEDYLKNNDIGLVEDFKSFLEDSKKNETLYKTI